MPIIDLIVRNWKGAIARINKDNPVPVSFVVGAGDDGAGVIAPAYTTATVTAVNVLALAANAARKQALFINDSDTVIYLGLGVNAVANQGIRLNAGGGSYEMSAMLGNLYRGQINAIHGGAGNKNLLVGEGS